jgi:hypothetical protein
MAKLLALTKKEQLLTLKLIFSGFFSLRRGFLKEGHFSVIMEGL